MGQMSAESPLKPEHQFNCESSNNSGYAFDYNHAKMALKHGRVIWKNGCFNILRFYALEFVKEFHKGIENQQ